MRLPPTYRPFPSFAEWAKAPVELKYWLQALEELADIRQRATPAQVEEAARFVTRATAVDTSAIEGLYSVDRGFTLSVAGQAGAWERDFEEKGQDARQHFEAQLQAAEVVLDAATGRWPVIEALIRGLHEKVCAAQPTYKVWTEQGWQEQELARGEYKRLPNNPQKKDGSEHAYAPVERVRDEMERLTGELGSEAFAQAPAPVQAAYAHYAFVSIHPFADGNGRVARALASIYLMRATSVPFLLFADERPSYFDALEAADRENYRELTSFVRDRSIGAMNYMSLSLRKAFAPKAETLRDESLRLIESLDPTETQLDILAMRLLDMVFEHVQAAFDELDLARQIRLTFDRADGAIWGAPSPPKGYRSVANLIGPKLILRLENPQIDFGDPVAYLVPMIAVDRENPMRLRVEEVQRGARFEAGPAELSPDVSQGLRVRLKLWSEALAAQIAYIALQQAQRSLAGDSLEG